MSLEFMMKLERDLKRREETLARMSPQERERFFRFEEEIAREEAKFWRESAAKAKPLFVKLAKELGWNVLVSIVSDGAKEGVKKLLGSN